MGDLLSLLGKGGRQCFGVVQADTPNPPVSAGEEKSDKRWETGSVRTRIPRFAGSSPQWPVFRCGQWGD